MIKMKIYLCSFDAQTQCFYRLLSSIFWLLTERTERKFNDNILKNNLIKISNYLDNFYVLSFHYFGFCLMKSMFDTY